MKKRIVYMIAAITTVIAVMCSCTVKKDSEKSKPEQGSEKKISVVTTIYPPYDFAYNIGGELADVTMLLKPGTESHHYDPTPQDIIKMQNCDLFIYGGGESDEWVKELLSSSGQKPGKVISMMECVNNLEEELVEGMQAESDNDNEEENGKEYDEHVWTSPKNALLISQKIADAMISLDEKNKPEYEANRDAYCQKLEELDASYKQLTENAVRKTIVFGDRFPFRYLANEYGLKYYAAFPGCSSESEPGAATVAFLIGKVREEKLPVVFTIEFSNGKVADTICEDTGAVKKQLHSCHNVTQEEFDAHISYIDLMKQNLENLREALN